MKPTLWSLVAAPLALLVFLGSTSLASAHPLGNYTVNRGVAVRVATAAITVRYVIDMAEIPAFSELQRIDRDGDGQTSDAEVAAHASKACATVAANLELRLDLAAVSLRSQGSPRLSFPAGAGGLPTLRLECDYRAAVDAAAGQRTVSVTDRTDDGHVGWREVTIAAGPGISLAGADVPEVSPSGDLTAYPVDALETPPDVRSGTARFRWTSGGSANPIGATPSAPLVRGTADDPFAALVGGELTPAAAIGALLLAVLLGAGHAVSPGHGKTLIAAYLIGSRGSVRHAVTLGVTVAVTHTAGVFLLGGVTLLVGQFFVPERVIEWLSIGSGALVAALGAGLVLRAIRGAGDQAAGDHAESHPHAHPHAHPRPHAHGEPDAPELRRRNVITLGLAGGMVPSASALIVFLVAITTGRLLFGMLLILGFGAGMAVVLGGLAVATTALRGSTRQMRGVAAHPWVKRAAGSLPLVSGVAVLVAGLSVSIGALARFA